MEGGEVIDGVEVYSDKIVISRDHSKNVQGNINDRANRDMAVELNCAFELIERVCDFLGDVTGAKPAWTFEFNLCEEDDEPSDHLSIYTSRQHDMPEPGEYPLERFISEVDSGLRRISGWHRREEQ